jgi:proton-translocating NADH-quinone oxidoreductase chain M
MEPAYYHKNFRHFDKFFFWGNILNTREVERYILKPQVAKDINLYCIQKLGGLYGAWREDGTQSARVWETPEHYCLPYFWQGVGMPLQYMGWYFPNFMRMDLLLEQWHRNEIEQKYFANIRPPGPNKYFEMTDRMAPRNLLLESLFEFFRDRELHNQNLLHNPKFLKLAYIVEKLKYNIFFSVCNILCFLNIDGLALIFIILISLLFPLCFLFAMKKIKYRYKEFIFLLLLLQLQLYIVFSVADFFFFYIFFESVLIPMFLIIGVWGSRQRKTHATFMFFFYTFIGSLFMLFGLFIIYSHLNTTNLFTIMTHSFSVNREKVLWVVFFIAFCIKVPMFPFHIWLPEAHVEAPTIGSVLLAGVLLKLGTYGLIRFCIMLFPYATYYYMPLIYTLCILAIIYGSCTTIRQIDLKKIIAYASIAHMNYVILGILASTNYGLAGSIFLMISHGFVSSGLFFLVGFLYDRYKTRLLLYYGGLMPYMPKFSFYFILFTLANISFPGTSNFIGEFLILLSLFDDNFFISLCATLSIILGAVLFDLIM